MALGALSVYSSHQSSLSNNTRQFHDTSFEAIVPLTSESKNFIVVAPGIDKFFYEVKAVSISSSILNFQRPERCSTGSTGFPKFSDRIVVEKIVQNFLTTFDKIVSLLEWSKFETGVQRY